MIVYCYHCIPTGKKYIGITRHEDRRKYHHRWNAENGYDQAFPRAIRKYGWDSFIYGVIECDLSLTEAKSRERYYISEYNTMLNGYNMTDGGDYTLLSPEASQRLSEAIRGTHHGWKDKDALRAHMKRISNNQSEDKKRRISETMVANHWHSQHWIIEMMDGTIHHVTNLRRWARANGYNERSIGCAYRRGKSHKDIRSITKTDKGE